MYVFCDSCLVFGDYDAAVLAKYTGMKMVRMIMELLIEMVRMPTLTMNPPK